MGKGLFPDYTAKNAYTVDYLKLYEMGYRGLIFDIDYTLVPYNAPADERALKLFEFLKETGFKCAFVSNNHTERVAGFNEKIGAAFVTDAMKPLKGGFEKAIRILGPEKNRMIAIGDQIFTDVWGANNAGIDSILTGRVVKAAELQLKLKAILEKLILFIYKRSGNCRQADIRKELPLNESYTH